MKIDQMKNKHKKQVKGVSLYFVTLLKTILFSVLACSLFVVIYGYVLPHFVDKDVLINPFKNPEETLNILVLGQDYASGCTDVIMLVNVNPVDNKVVAMSIPRDTRVSYNGSYRKINSIYHTVGIDVLEDKIEEITGIKVDNYMLADTKGFRNIIDILGGVDLEITKRMKYTDTEQGLYIDFSPGMQHLDGEKAEEFMRFRSYANGDIDRISAQQSFFKALAEQKLQPKYLTKIDDIISEIFDCLTTDLKLATLINYSSFAAKLGINNITFLTASGMANYIGGVSYYVVDLNGVEEQVETYIFGNVNDIDDDIENE